MLWPASGRQLVQRVGLHPGVVLGEPIAHPTNIGVSEMRKSRRGEAGFSKGRIAGGAIRSRGTR
jgi:hypothetical protein